MLDETVRQAPDALVNSAVSWCPEIENMKGCCIAGGFIRAYYAGERPSDMDVYFERESRFNTGRKLLKKNGWVEAAVTDRAVTMLSSQGKAVQLIGFIYGDRDTIIKEFDFTVCMVGMTLQKTDAGAKGLVTMHKNFFEHLAGRILVYTGSKMPLASMKRMVKYIKRGYHICDENLIKIAEDIAAAVDFTDEESVQEHIAGMDPTGERRVRVID